MAKLFLKKKSKRITCRMKYKIEKKVREHNRKKRSSAKKDPFLKGKSAHKKVNYIPNDCPFKASILEEAAAEKERKEAERLAKHEQWKVEREAAKVEAESMKSLVDEAAVREQEHEKERKEKEKPDDVERTYRMQGALKTYYREFKKVVNEADVILQVLDARDPLGTRCIEVEKAVLEAPGNKRLIIVLNKADLVSRENLDEWLKYLRRSFPTTPMKATTQAQKAKHSQRLFNPDGKIKGSGSVGVNLLLHLLANYCRNKGIKTAITVGVVGMPNVGKSSIINSLKRGKACEVGSVPGVTKVMQTVQLDSKIKLLDSPGVVMSKQFDTESALKNVVDVAALRNAQQAAEAILMRADKAQLAELYGILPFDTSEEFLFNVAKRYGRQRKGGIYDVNMAAKILVQDWNKGKIKYHTVPPEDSYDTHVSAEIVKQMVEEFSLDDLSSEHSCLRFLDDKRVGVEKSLLLQRATEMDVDSQAGDVLADNVRVDGGAAKKKVRWRKDVASTKEKEDKEMKIEGNLKINKAKKLELKKLKKAKARTGRKTDDLADVLEGFSFDGEKNMEDEPSPKPTKVAQARGGPNDAYDFNTDFAM